MTSPNLNMLTDPVFPVVGVSGLRRWASFAELLDESGDHPVGFDWPRGDLNVASAEFAIGILALIHRPTDEKDWRAIWDDRGAAAVGDGINWLAPFFNLFGDAEGEGPRFCQDLEPFGGEPNAVESLFIDTPGANGREKNADLMTHRDRFPALGLPAAAITLYAMQQFAPPGGRGNRTSMRGGGPMTTLVLPTRNGGPAPLKRLLLLNLVPLFGGADGWLEDDAIGRALPWLNPTITSDGKPPRDVAEKDPAAHPAQAFFGMPRRIRLVADGEGLCSLTGRHGPLVTGFVQKPWGTNYSVWTHPTTPYRQNKDETPYTVKPKPGRFGYRDWVAVTVGRDERADRADPAKVVKALQSRGRDIRRFGFGIRLLAAGWAMNNMEAERFFESVQPLHLPANGGEDRGREIAETARRFADAADAAMRLLRSALNEALFGGQAKSTDAGPFAEATDAFYERTEQAFHEALQSIADDGIDAERANGLALDWLRTIRRAALAIFDEHATDLLPGADVKDADRITRAYGQLFGGLTERAKLAVALGIAQPVRTKGGAVAATAPLEGA
ncbi:type I-E CRISPR-associated protein Cse1/CasA [Aquibium microcysteis]|uniref:type I-E CRISPR-associated protein Cse1/CasA n=1 Tax=Aquibium microcysteis TaxID=675281 RepID=UPI00165CF868|nr:type I-E CRISPR-associated protein Cse1/CasA [Aquibium microcysteis]